MANNSDFRSKASSLRLFAKGFILSALAASLSAHASDDLTALSLEQLMSLTVTGASKYEHKQNAVAAAVSINQRGESSTFRWRTL